MGLIEILLVVAFGLPVLNGIGFALGMGTEADIHCAKQGKAARMFKDPGMAGPSGMCVDPVTQDDFDKIKQYQEQSND